MEITKNVVKENKDNGIYVDTSSNLNLENNEVESSGYDGISISDSNDTKIIKNKVKKNKNHGIYVKSSKNTIISNNSIENNQGTGILCDGGNIQIMSNNI